MVLSLFKTKVFPIFIIGLLIFSVLLAVQSAPSVQAGGTTYYVSKSNGNDKNNGKTSTKPWKSLTKVSSVTFRPGDKILFKCGDTWTGETLYLNTNNGSSKNWITVSSYGKGVKPRIWPGAKEQYSIVIYNEDETIRNCGWKFLNLDVGYAHNGISSFDMRYCDNTAANVLDGLWIENCYIHDITGNNIKAKTYPEDMSSGIRITSSHSWLSNVTILNDTFQRNDVAISGWNLKGFVIQSSNCYNSNYWGYEFWGSKNGLIQDCKVLYTGQKVISTGTTSIEFDHTTESITVNRCELAYAQSVDGPDGCGVDYEGFNYNITTSNCYIHDNTGYAFLFMPYAHAKTNIINNLCVNNGLDFGEPSFISYSGDGVCGGSAGSIVGNVIVRAAKTPSQALFKQDNESSEAFPRGLLQYNNTVLNAGSNYQRPTEYIAKPSYNPTYRKTWSFADSAEGWKNPEYPKNVSIKSGVLTEKAGDVTQLLSEDNLNLDVTWHQIVRIRMKNNSSSDNMTLNWTTTTQSGSYSFPVSTHDKTYKTYVLDLSVVRGYTDILQQLSLEPGILEGKDTLSIDYIALSNK